MALGGDGSCKEAGLSGVRLARQNHHGRNTPKLHRNERKDPGLSAGVYEHHFLGLAYERNVRNGGLRSLAIPRGKLNAASLSLKRLEGLIENEKVEMKLITKRLRMETPTSVRFKVPWLERRQPARASSRQRRTEHLVLTSRE
jgi:hypothetical protein